MNTISAQLLKELFVAGATALNDKKEYVNELNVFPVPDGDTGTNMTMTIQSAVKEVEAVTDVTMANVCKAISSGSLRGARGNSGVILSQLLRGLTRHMRECEEIDIYTLSEAFEKAVETAYKAVMKPKEGTILTVARAGAEAAVYLADKTSDLLVYAQAIVDYMRYALNLTPEMLPVLKEAGVVDSGGEGLIIVIEGVLEYLKKMEPSDKTVSLPDLSSLKEDFMDRTYDPKKAAKASKKDKASKKENKDNKKARPPRKPASKAEISTADIKFGYCTEFIIMLEREFYDKDEEELKIFLEAIGDSIVVVSDDEIVKVHVHTNMPGIAIQKALTYGSLTKMKIDNMREEHNERVMLDAQKEAKKASVETDEEATEVEAEEIEAVDAQAESYPDRAEAGFIAVSAGEGLSEIFAGLGADIVIEGGQTMNPSTEDILGAIEQINANNIFILPNNSNIILASEQAKSLVEDKNIIVIPSKTIPQGIMAILNYMPNKTWEENEKTMLEEMGHIKSGSVTYSIRDTVIQDIEIKQGDIMGIGDQGIMNTGAQVLSTTVELINKLIDEDSELITLYYGKDTTEDEASLIAAKIQKEHPDIEVEVHYGGQPVYYYFVSVE